MSFMDNFRDRLAGARRDTYEDDYYDDYADAGSNDQYDSYASAPTPRRGSHFEPAEPGHGLLGNSSRPTAESISVYTRAGEFVDSNSEGIDHTAPAPYDRNAPLRDGDGWTDSRLDYNLTGTSSSTPRHTTSSPVQTEPSSAAATRVSSGKLPAYVITPLAYDDVETVMRRVRTNQPVVLNFRTTNIETAKRILDFCFGLTCGLGGRVDELGERVFVVLPANVELGTQDMQKLQRDGIIS